MALEPRSVADFHAETMARWASSGWTSPSGRSPRRSCDAIPFAEDTEHASYDAAAVRLFWRRCVQAPG